MEKLIAREYNNRKEPDMYQSVLFDLDGTLTDPGTGITNSVAYALEQFGISVTDRTVLYKFIGPPLHESFEKFYGFSKADALAAVDCYREYYHDKGIYENILYKGIEDLLQTLSDHGKKLFVATSKPEPYAIRILEHFHIRKYFTFTAGASMDSTRCAKADVIARALEKGRISDPASAIMIGDRQYDIAGAKQTAMASMGVLYGYGSREELESAGADFIAETVPDIARFLIC